MRLIAFDQDGAVAHGVLLGSALSQVVPLASLPSPATDLMSLLAAGPEALCDVAARAAAIPADRHVALDGLRRLPPIPRPGKIICIGLNYAEHAREGGNAIPDYPAIFLRGPTSLVGHGGAIRRPRASTQLDYEGELAFIIGRTAHHVPEERALDHVAGYACFNESTIRDFQRRSSQWTVGKNFDATGGFGPALVTADALPPGAHGLRLRTRVNGETLQDSTTADMIFGVARLVAILSAAMTLEPGDVVATGTPSGVGYARKPPRWLTPGDVVEVEIEGIGTLSNPVADEPA